MESRMSMSLDDLGWILVQNIETDKKCHYFHRSDDCFFNNYSHCQLTELPNDTKKITVVLKIPNSYIFEP